MNDGGVMKKDRLLSYGEAIRETLGLIMEEHPEVIIFGEGVNDLNGMFGSTVGLHQKFGNERVFDVPLSETAITGVGVGAALGGLHPIYCHNRPDFLFLAMDQIVNHAAKYRYMSGGQCSVPYIVWATTGQGWGSAAQHSQELHGLFMQVPGLKIISPTTPYDVKGMLISAIADSNPVLFLDHRRLYELSGEVPEDMYSIPFGKADVKVLGKDLSIIAVSSMVPESIKAANWLMDKGISVEVVDIRSIRPLDMDTIVKSVEKTGRALVIDNSTPIGGLGAEISASIAELLFDKLKQPVKRLSYPDTPVPAAYVLEDEYFISWRKIADTVLSFEKE